MKIRKANPKTWSRKGRCPSCDVGTGSRHKASCTFKYEEDNRKGQKVVCTLEIEDRGQDFLEIDVLQNGVILGNSVMFSHGRLSLLGIGSDNGEHYHSAVEVIQAQIGALDLKGLTIYLKETGEKDPLPWKAQTLKYPVVAVKKAEKPNRFL